MLRTTINRLFFAIRPPIQLARSTAHAAEILEVQPVAAERLHITMFILDDLAEVDRFLVTALCAIGESIAIAPIAVVLDRLVANTRSTALRPSATNAALVGLHDQLARLAADAGIAERRDYRFGAHMTLGYRDGLSLSASGSKRVAPVEWLADELVLIHSHVGRTRHDELGRWRLAGPAEPQLSLF